MNLLIAAMSSGKSLVNGPIDCIIEDLVQMDKVNRQKEQDWKDEVNTMATTRRSLCARKTSASASFRPTLPALPTSSVSTMYRRLAMLISTARWTR